MDDVAAFSDASRHGSGREASTWDAVKLVGGCPLCLVWGVVMIRWGIVSGLLSVVGLGLVPLALGLLMIPEALPVLIRSLRYRRS